MKKFLQDNKWIKQCPRCKEIKEIIHFNKNKSEADGYADRCKICSCNISKQWYHKNKEKRIKKIKEYELRNVEKFRKIRREWAKNRRKTHLQYKLKSN